ncbi:MAG: MBL fold metallo-hydrolase [Actinomycetota bacterium]
MTVLGSSGMFATRERACAGYILAFGDHKIWLDAGSGSWRNMLDAVDHKTIDGIILSHRHPDHTSDLFQAYHARQYGQPEPLPRIPVWAPQETVDAILGFVKHIEDSFDVRTVKAGEELTIGGAQVSFVEMAHPTETVGVRVDHDGAVFAYSADTGSDADFESLAGGSGLFLCEATSQDSDDLWEGHLRASQAGEIAARVGTSLLLLTHLRPGRDHELTFEQARRTSGDVAVELASDGKTWPVRP